MNQFVLFKNASNSLTTLPLETVSRLELALMLEAGDALVGANDMPVEAFYPRGTPFHYHALELPCRSATIPAMAED